MGGQAVLSGGRDDLLTTCSEEICGTHREPNDRPEQGVQPGNNGKEIMPGLRVENEL